ncbi:MAG: TonB-dependent receptor, partial [Muribaculaceae bacterium]|nr:TonB-dependent receptor [Muribaculaceae bacterium]
KVRHQFSDKTTGSIGIYYGEDFLNRGDKTSGTWTYSVLYNDQSKFRWGNIVVRAGIVQTFRPNFSAEFTAAYTRYFGKMKTSERDWTAVGDSVVFDEYSEYRTENHVDDYIARADFDWRPDIHSTVRFGASYTFHSFLPAQSEQKSIINGATSGASSKGFTYHAHEVNGYIEDDWKAHDRLRLNVGLHASMFDIDNKVHGALSPRAAVNWRATDQLSVKAAYTRTVQYVHHLSRSYLSLPTDQWVPITGNFKPQTADKVSVGAYWQSSDGQFTASVEGYLKKMHNLVDYLDEYYLASPLDEWNGRLTSGRGTAKGIDFMVSRTFGKVTGHVSYSLSHTDRTFADKNGGVTYPARFDIPHSVKVLVNWQISPKVALNANWTGHSGNLITFMTGSWDIPEFDSIEDDIYYGPESAPLKAPINNYRLPFYHRLDLSLTVTNRHGYWSFGLYNAYNHLNTITIRRSTRQTTSYDGNGGFDIDVKPVFQKVALLPIIPSISYTWQF